MKNKNEPRDYKVYKIENTANGQCYVGLTSSDWSTRKSVTKYEAFKKDKNGDWRYHTPIYASYRIDGEHFVWTVLEELHATREVAGKREDYWIRKLNTIYPNGMNCEFGGDSGKRVYEDRTRSKLIDRSTLTKRSWEKLTPEQRAARKKRISKTLKQYQRTPEHEANLSAAKASAWARKTPEERAAWSAKANKARWSKRNEKAA